MPIYGYKCDTCKKEVDIELKITKYKPTLPCSCGGTLFRSFTNSPPPILFKGSDWADKEVRRKRNEDRTK